MKLTAEIEQITPRQAAEYLSLNPMNRQIQHHLVRLYLRQMREGNWKLIPAPICFSKEPDGFLLQGQHRLSAQVESNTIQEYLVCRGVDKSLFSLLDTGMSRNGEDMLFVEGNFNHPALYSSLILQFMKWQNNTFFGHGNRAERPMPAEILEYGLKNKADLATTINFVKDVEGRGKYLSERMFSASYHIITHYAKAEAVQVQKFFKSLINGKTEDMHPALIWLRDELVVNKSSSRKLAYQNLYSSIFYAWNGFNGKNGKFIPVNPESCRDVHPT